MQQASNIEKLLLWVARVSGLVGLALCAAAVATRVGGAYVLGSYQVGTLLLGGMAAMMVASLAYLAVLVER